MKPENFQQIRNILLRQDYPSQIITISRVDCKFTFTPEDFPVDIDDLCTFAEKHIQIFDEIGTPLNIRNIPSVLFYYIIQKYSSFRKEILESLFTNIDEYSQTVDSRTLWKIIGNIGKDSVMQGEWDGLRNYWASKNVTEDNNDKWEMTRTIFDALQPWLNHDLWKAVKNKDDKRRINITEEIDDDLAERMNDIALKQWQAQRGEIPPAHDNDDLDEITIEDSF